MSPFDLLILCIFIVIKDKTVEFYFIPSIVCYVAFKTWGQYDKSVIILMLYHLHIMVDSKNYNFL